MAISEKETGCFLNGKKEGAPTHSGHLYSLLNTV
jgi:hypothetical protein